MPDLSPQEALARASCWPNEPGSVDLEDGRAMSRILRDLGYELRPMKTHLFEYGHCGSLAWTVEKWGRATHKHSCPNRTDPWCQTHPYQCDEPIEQAAEAADREAAGDLKSLSANSGSESDTPSAAVAPESSTPVLDPPLDEPDGE